MNYWTIKKQIALGLSILILINVVVGIFTSSAISKVKFFVENISSSQLQGIHLLSQVQSEENKAYDLMLQALLANSKDEVAASSDSIGGVDAGIDQLLADYADGPTAGDRAKAMTRQIVADRIALQQAWAPVRDLSANLQGKDAYVLFKKQTAPAFEKLKSDLQAEIDTNKNLADTTARESIALTDSTSNVVNFSIIMTLSAC